MFCGVLVLAMTPSGTVKIPPLFLYQFHDLPHLHRTNAELPSVLRQVPGANANVTEKAPTNELWKAEGLPERTGMSALLWFWAWEHVGTGEAKRHGTLCLGDLGALASLPALLVCALQQAQSAKGRRAQLVAGSTD